MKILITGGLGFIGSNLAKKCIKDGHIVTIADNLDKSCGGNIFNVDQIKDDVKLFNIDISNYNKIKPLVLANELVVNCAAKTSHSYSMKKPLENYDSNIIGLMNILEIIKQNDRSIRLIQLGTTSQLGPLVQKPAKEDHPEFPLDIYSANKVVCEKYCLIYNRSFDLKINILRLSNVYGPRAAIHSPEFTFNNYFIGRALKKKLITIYTPGSQLRNIVYVGDIVNAIVKFFKNESSFGEVFFMTGDEHFSVKEIAQKTCSVIGGELKLVEWPEDAKHIEIGDVILSNEKIKSHINWRPKISIDEGLKMTYQYYKKYYQKYFL